MHRLSIRVVSAVVGLVFALPHMAAATAPGVIASQAERAIGPQPAPGYVRLPGHVLSALAHATVVDSGNAGAAADAERQIALTVVLKRDDPDGFQRYLHDVYDPRSPRYHRFLTPEQISAQFGPSRASYSEVLAYFESQGFRLVRGSQNHLTLTVSGTRAAAERALATRLNEYEAGTRRFYANDSDPALPIKVAARTQSVIGLSDLAAPRPEVQAIRSAICAYPTALNVYFSAEVTKLNGVNVTLAEERAAYQAKLKLCIAGLGNTRAAYSYIPGMDPPPPAWQAVDGTGQTVGLVEFDTFNISDVADYIALVGLPTPITNITQKNVNGGVGSTPGANQDEVLLDIDDVIAIAPGAKVVVYDAPFAGPNQSFQAVFNAMIDDRVNVISNSWSYCEDQTTAADAQSIDAILQTAAAAGISVFNGSGDSGSTCLDGSANTIGVPADSPSATAVGGSSLTVGPGETYGSEAWWNGANDSPATGQGGFGTSRFFSKPSYQASLNTGGARSIPDVVANADPAKGGEICAAALGGCPTGELYGGTSGAAPSWAGFTALLNQAQGSNLGALNPQLYALAGTDSFHGPSVLGSDFAHVGLGSPDLARLHQHLTKQTPGAVSGSVSTLFVTAAGNFGLSTSSALPMQLPADGATAAQIAVRVVDAEGNSIDGATVSLAANSGNQATITPASAVTRVDNGSAVFTVTDLTAEALTLTATAAGVPLTQQAFITFGVPPASSANLSVFPTTVTADNTSTTTLTVLMKDSLGRPTPGKVVDIQQGTGHSVIKGPSPSVTDSTGQIQFTATDDQNETVTYTAIDVSDGNLTIPGTGTVTFSSAGSSDCTANPAMGANGYVVTTFASNFPASDFFFSDINYSGCPGANNPFFTPSGSVAITDFNTGDVYELGVAGGAVSSSDIIASIGQSVGVPVVGKDGSLYAARYGTTGSFSSGDVVQLDPTTFAIVREVATGLTCPSSLVVDPISGDLFFDDQCTGGGSDNPSVFRVTGPSGANPTVSTYATLPVAGGQEEMAFSPNGTLYAISGGFANTSEVVSVTATNSANPGTVSVISGITPDNGSLNIGQVNADGSAKTLLLHVAANNGTLETVDITTSPPTVATVLANGDIGAGIVGPDGCFYVGAHHLVYKIAPAAAPCTLTPAVTAPSLALAPASVSPNPAQGTAQTFTATLAHASTLSGVPVTFQVAGANPQIKQVRTNSAGQAVLTYTALAAGKDTVTASATASQSSGTVLLNANPVAVTWTAGTHVSYLTLNLSPAAGTLETSVKVVASLTDLSASPTAPAAGQTITFKLGTATCVATTGANGQASCSLTPAQSGLGTLTASFAGGSQLTAATASIGFNVLAGTGPAPTVTISASPATIAAGSSATLTWSSTNATACTASGAWSGTQATSGTSSVTPATNGSYSYTLTCTGSGGSASATATLSATLAEVTVTAKSGGGAIGWYLLLCLGALVVVRHRTSLLQPREFVRDGAGVALLVTLLTTGAVDSVRAQTTAGASAASSALDPVYVGIRVGGMPVRQDAGRIDQGLADRGYGDVTASSDSSGTAGTVFVGYEFTSYAAVELGYTFREATAATLRGTIGSAASLTPLLNDTTGLIRGYGNIVSLSYAGRFELLPRFNLEPRLGGFFWATKVTAVGFDDRVDTTHEGGGITAGLTAAYRVWRGLELGVSVDHYRGNPSNIATLYAGTLEWRFGP
jgi:kumamolisin